MYKFVSFPEILKMDPQAVEMGLASGRVALQEVEAQELEEEEEEEEEAQRKALSALGAQACRNDYLRSGLYSSFSVASLHNQPELLRALREHQDEARTVIRFGTNAGERTAAPPLPASKHELFLSARPSPHYRRSPPSSPHSPASRPRQGWSPEAEEEGTDSDQGAQPLNLSSGHRERAQQLPEKRSSSNSGSSNQGDGLPPKTKKPKALEISAHSLLLSGSDIGRSEEHTF